MFNIENCDTGETLKNKNTAKFQSRLDRDTFSVQFSVQI